MRVLSLFSGGGLGDYGLTLAGMEIVGQVEIDDYCQKILTLRWPEVPKWREIREVKGKEIIERCGRIDLISGGFPCQPHSFAGKRRGASDDRNLWPEMSRVISEVRPTWVLAENVLGVLGFAESVVLPDLERQGYETITLVFPAHAIGAPHKRDRVWIVAHSGHRRGRDLRTFKTGETDQGQRAADHGPISGSGEQFQHVADTDGTGRQERQRESAENLFGTDAAHRAFTSHWISEPDVGRVAHGVPNRVDRLKMLGNGQVPQVVQWIGRQIMKAEKQSQAQGREGSDDRA